MRRVTLFQNSVAATGFSRTAVEDEIERLFALLDRLDGDPDLEDDPDSEPWLSLSEEAGEPVCFERDGIPLYELRNYSDDDREVDDDREPDLGWTLTMAHGNGRDLEANEVTA